MNSPPSFVIKRMQSKSSCSRSCGTRKQSSSKPNPKKADYPTPAKRSASSPGASICRTQVTKQAWTQLIDPQGFWAPFGITTAERRHPKFRSHGVGKCEWDGAVWPFATSQTLNALANVLRNYNQSYVTREHYLEAIQAYVQSQHMNGKPYIGEYLDEMTGEWLKGDNPRSRYYNHSTFADLIIAGLVGIVPRADDAVRNRPAVAGGIVGLVLSAGCAVSRQADHGRVGSTTARFGKRAGLSAYVDDKLVAQSERLGRLSAQL